MRPRSSLLVEYEHRGCRRWPVSGPMAMSCAGSDTQAGGMRCSSGGSCGVARWLGRVYGIDTVTAGEAACWREGCMRVCGRRGGGGGTCRAGDVPISDVVRVRS
jgi:hypothetical protein